MKSRLVFVAMLIGLTLFSVNVFSIDTKNTRLMEQPVISANHIAFIYANDLWVANLDGSNPKRLTVDEGVESHPSFSPDGKTIAFSAMYDGNTDVYVIPVEGGVPKRLTWHSEADIVEGFTLDGQNILFSSRRTLHTYRYTQLLTVGIDGGFPKLLDIPNGGQACYSPDGKFMAYNPAREAFRMWKNYRGGTMSEIWVFSMEDHSKYEIPKPEGGCNDVNAMWVGDMIYFLSDRNGEFNLFSFHTESKAVKQLTKYTDFPIISSSSNGDNIIFEQAGYLHTYNLESGINKRLKVGIATDLLGLRSRYVSSGRYIRGADISPSGARAVFDFRGEIITVPGDKGDPRNITNTTGVHEKMPSWSPDGKEIAYISDARGEYNLHIKSQDGRGEEKVITLEGTGFYADPEWSPDGKKITYVDNGRNFYVVDLASASIDKIASDEKYAPGQFRYFHGDWSFDSKWIAYSRILGSSFTQLFLYSIDEKISYPVTDGLSDASEPIFDRSGKYLYFFASTDAGPVVNWFDQSNSDNEVTSNIYLVCLQKETLSPFAKESDEEVQDSKDEEKDEGEGEKEDKKKKGDKKKKDDDEDAEEKELVIDLDGLQNRIIDIPLARDKYYGLECAKEDEILYIKRNNGNTLHKYSLKDREDKEVAPIDNYLVSADGKKMLYLKNGSWGISNAGEKPSGEKGKIRTSSIEVKIDPLAEWPQIFDEAWRVNRDYFYDPGMHGVDWDAMKEKYEQFLPHLSCRGDLNKVIMWMGSELGVGHHRVGGGDRLTNTKWVGCGLLGANYAIENGRYRITKVFEGLNWNPKLRSPLTEPGLNVKVGEYILEVNGEALTSDMNIYRSFENTAGKIVDLKVGPNPDGKGAREIQVVPVGNEYTLRNRDWVEGNMKKVHEATNGEVAYVYVPNTAGLGHEYFKRYFYPQADKKAIIIDERYNSGGQLADYYIDMLLRPYQSHWNMRYTTDLKTPSASIQGPRVMIIDENAGSGGDMLPWMFRKFDVGTLVGKTTWGGLVGVLGFPELMDGGYITAPNVAIWTEDGFIVENVGVAPDIEVEQTPSALIEGHDPQLEKAIEVALEQLRMNPPKEPKRPDYPVRGSAVWK